LALAFGLSFVTGWVNSIFFVRYKAFATMVSGNYLMMSFSLALWVLTRGHANIADPDSDWMTMLPPPTMYGLFLALSLMGAAFHRVMVIKREWTATTFAPLVASGLLAHELLSYLVFGRELHTTWHIAPFALICGIMNKVGLSGGLSTLPYCTTTNYMTLGDTLGKMLVGEANAAELKIAVKTLVLLAGTTTGAVSGIILDTLTPWNWDFELTLMAPVLAGLYLVHDRYFQEAPELPR